MKTGDFKMGPDEWGAAAENYARLREPLTLPYGLDTLAALQLEPAQRLLDLAAGTGGVALAAARLGAEVVAGDWSPGMVAYVAARANREGVDGITARVLDGQNLELASDTFDAACSVFGLMFFSNHRASLVELRRVLKPGGRIGIAVWQTPDRMEHLAVWDQAARRLNADVPSFARPSAWLQMETSAGLQRELEATGFREVSVTAVAHPWPVPSVEWFIENFDASQTFCDRHDTASRDQLRAVVRTQLHAAHGDGPFTLTAHAHIGIAVK